jgi:hypothetical protein
MNGSVEAVAGSVLMKSGPVKSLYHRTKDKKEILSVLIAQKHLAPSIPSGCDVIHGIWIFNS